MKRTIELDYFMGRCRLSSQLRQHKAIERMNATELEMRVPISTSLMEQ